MSRAAAWLLALAGAFGLLAAGSGLLLLSDFRSLLVEGAGGVTSFASSRAVTAHRWLGLAAALGCLPVAATGLLLGLHGLLAAHGPRLRAGLLGALAPLLLALGLGAAYTGHGDWGRTRMGELDPERLEAFLALHGLGFGGGFLVAAVLFGAGLVWLRRAEQAEDED